MSDGPTPPKEATKVEQTQQTLAEKEVAAVEQESQSLSEKPAKENESVVTSEQLPMGLDVLQNKKSVKDEEAAKVEQTQQTLAEKADPTVEQESTSRSEMSVIEEAPVTRAEFDALSAKLGDLIQGAPVGRDEFDALSAKVSRIEKVQLEEKTLGVASIQSSAEKGGNPISLPESCTSSEPAVQSECPVQPRLFFSAQKNQCYDIDEGKKGLVAIINNFTDKSKNRNDYRKGTVEDEKRICSFFETGDFAQRYRVHKPETDEHDLPIPWRDLRKPAFMDAIKQLTEILDNSNAYNSFFLFIMSHGDKDGIMAFHEMGGEAEHITIDAINEYFKKSIKDCPKVIVIQACRGPARNEDLADRKADTIQQAADDFDDLCDDPRPGMRVTIPDTADMLIALSTVKGYTSYRQRDGSGSWFLRYLFEQLIKAHKSKYYSSHLWKLLPEVLRLVADNTRCAGKQMPCFESTLRKKFYLLRPVLPQ